MNVCICETWTLKKIADALESGDDRGRKIRVPSFQRSIVWKDEQRKAFIDSVKNGFPIGTMLFSRSEEESNEVVYTLIDGLQRSSTIKEYMKNPTSFFNDMDINEDLITDITDRIHLVGNQDEISKKIKYTLKSFIKNNDDISDIQYSEFTDELACVFPVLNEDVELKKFITSIIKPFIKKYKEDFLSVCEAEIPIIIYTGDEKNLPTIFERINNQGTALTRYQIYAAS